MTPDSQTLALLLHRHYPYGPCVFGVTQTKHEAKKAGYVGAEHVRDLRGWSSLTTDFVEAVFPLLIPPLQNQRRTRYWSVN